MRANTISTTFARCDWAKDSAFDGNPWPSKSEWPQHRKHIPDRPWLSARVETTPETARNEIDQEHHVGNKSGRVERIFGARLELLGERARFRISGVMRKAVMRLRCLRRTCLAHASFVHDLVHAAEHHRDHPRHEQAKHAFEFSRSGFEAGKSWRLSRPADVSASIFMAPSTWQLVKPG